MLELISSILALADTGYYKQYILQRQKWKLALVDASLDASPEEHDKINSLLEVCTYIHELIYPLVPILTLIR